MLNHEDLIAGMDPIVNFTDDLINPIITKIDDLRINESKPITTIVFCYGIPTRMVIEDNPGPLFLNTGSVPHHVEAEIAKTSHPNRVISTYITAGTSADTHGYIARLKRACETSSRVQNGIIIKGPGGNDHYYLSDSRAPNNLQRDQWDRATQYRDALLAVTSSSNITYESKHVDPPAIHGLLNNPAGYASWGFYSSAIGTTSSIIQDVEFTGNVWYAMTTIESYNGRLDHSNDSLKDSREHGGYQYWLRPGAFHP